MNTTPTSPIGIKAPPSFNPSPKQRFREHANNITLHKDLIAMPEFERAIDFAMLEFNRKVSAEIKDTNSALAAGYKLQAVNEFIEVLRTLTEQRTPSQVVVNDNLSGNLR